MVRIIFINLPVRDLAASRDFYAALGFPLNPHSSDGETAAVVLSDSIVVFLRTAEKFRQLAGTLVTEEYRASNVLHCVEVDSRSMVDDLVERAQACGGKTFPIVDVAVIDRDDPSSIRSFSDPDGHQWQVMFMEPRHIIN